MTYGTALVDTIQSSTANTPVVFKDGNGTQIGTLCRAWVNFNGTGTVAIRASFNVSSITDNGTGDYTVNFTTALPDANYCVSGSANESSGTVFTWLATGTGTPNTILRTTSAIRVQSIYANNFTADCDTVNVAVFR